MLPRRPEEEEAVPTRQLSRRRLLCAVVSTAALLPIVQACATAPPAATPAPAQPTAPAPTTAPAGAAPAAAAKPTAEPAAPAKPAAAVATVPIATAKPVTAPRVKGQIVVSNWHVGSGQPSQLAQDMLAAAYKKVQPDVSLVW